MLKRWSYEMVKHDFTTSATKIIKTKQVNGKDGRTAYVTLRDKENIETFRVD